MIWNFKRFTHKSFIDGNFKWLWLNPLLVSGLPYSESDSDLYDYMNDESSANVNTESSTSLQKTPSFISTPQVLVVDEGDTVRLPCSVDRLEGFVMLWKKQNDILTVASQIIETVQNPTFLCYVCCKYCVSLWQHFVFLIIWHSTAGHNIILRSLILTDLPLIHIIALHTVYIRYLLPEIQYRGEQKWEQSCHQSS